ncbi:ATP-dependent DNA helicase [Curtobacterium ammoniigenes]|uniref:ATP-dependent DNA helicase n=1 Tax=Curtobacterium ammoniigenes TaxID=395387 RepID=UPI001FE1C565|nr:ATP-dependent DNA helicase [Curtobacterium ammoniigenes]
MTDTAATNAPRASDASLRYTALDIAEALGMPAPTPQQRAVIESPLEPALVVAGAGSGKTETMAGRVVWLLANGFVEPDQVLGLTFTRKAAGELSARIGRRIAGLEAAGLIPATDAFQAPTVSTYNAFANTVFREHALLVGRDSESQVLSEPSAWQLARSVVVGSSDDRLAALERSVDTLTRAVLDVNGAASEHLADLGTLRAFSEQFRQVLALPDGAKSTIRPAIRDMVKAVDALEPLADLVDAFRRRKIERGLVEFSDQVALALAAADAAPIVASRLRARFGVVLLDEYQDTSVVQTRFLARIFAGTPVMAVGDPHQSIYGFRGASAANLARFPADFGANACESNATYALSTSWRNAANVLHAANVIVEPLGATVSAPVEALTPRPAAPDGAVETVFTETLSEEAQSVARWFGGYRRKHPDGSMALLMRSRTELRTFTSALDAEGVPHHVLGSGGLLLRPEIVDLTSCLRVLHDPAAGNALIRLMAGARWRIGPADIAALADVSRWLFHRDHAHQPLDDAVHDALRASVAAGEHGSLVDALDFVATAPDDHRAIATISAEGRSRMRRLGSSLARLRTRARGDLVEFVWQVVRDMQLDVELAAHEGADARGVDAFFDALSSFVQTDDRADLGSFLGWLDAAGRKDDLGPRSEEPEPGCVQILTIHGAKGLEWDAVAVVRMVEGGLPGASNEGATGWLRLGSLPYAFRGDASELPVFGWRSATSQRELIAALDRFKSEVAAGHEQEERRLAYVAMTRARDALLLSGSFWGRGKRAKTPSRYLRELAARSVIDPDAVPEASAHDENPMADLALTAPWPNDGLGGRAARVHAAADAVRSAAPGDDDGPYGADIDLLLAERSASLSGTTTAHVPHRIPASGFKDYLHRPDEVAARIRRPLPDRPYRATRLGTLFHRWVEERSAPSGTVELLDAWPDELDDAAEAPDAETEASVLDDDEATRLRAFQSTFARSRWADRTPIDVEREIHIPFLGHSVVCKIDAVYETATGCEIVDWKTGRPPSGARELDERSLQLSLYRLAYAEATGRSLDSIDAVFFYVAADQEIRATSLLDRAALEARWRGVFSQERSPAGIRLIDG